MSDTTAPVDNTTPAPPAKPKALEALAPTHSMLLDHAPHAIRAEGQDFDIPYFDVRADDFATILKLLYEQAHFTLLTDITAVHYPDRKDEEICVVYHLHNLRVNRRLKLKVYLPISRPHVATATNVFAGANWMERETYDFFGVIFEGHPNLERLLNVTEMTYFPLRKEYPLEEQTREDKDDAMFGRGDIPKPTQQ